jgi:ribonuclease M5
MYKVKETIVVEGVYDKIKLSRFLDAVIITTNGFRVFSDGRILESIKKMAQETGIVILTDSDSAGFKIRNYIKQSMPEGTVKHAYVPDVKGKEKRKREAGKEGLLGVEGIKDDIILNALIAAGCSIDGNASKPKEGRAVTKADLYKLGLSGGNDSHKKRASLAAALGIPMKISANMLLDIVNRLLDYDEFCEIVQNINEDDK